MLINTKYSIGDKVYFRCMDTNFNGIVREAVIKEINIKSNNTVTYIANCDVSIHTIELVETDVFGNKKEAEKGFIY